MGQNMLEEPLVKGTHAGEDREGNTPCKGRGQGKTPGPAN